MTSPVATFGARRPFSKLWTNGGTPFRQWTLRLRVDVSHAMSRRNPEDLERQRIAESCAQVRRVIEEEPRMPDVPVVVVTAMSLRYGNGEGDRQLTADGPSAHGRARSHGRLVLAEKSSYDTLLSSHWDLIVSTVRSTISH